MIIKDLKNRSIKELEYLLQEIEKERASLDLLSFHRVEGLLVGDYYDLLKQLILEKYKQREFVQ